MKRLPRILLIMLLPLLSISSCKKKPLRREMDIDSKLYYSQKVGSWYVYRDSISGVLDTFTVNYVSLGETYLDANDCNSCNEILETGRINMHSDSSSWLQLFGISDFFFKGLFLFEPAYGSILLSDARMTKGPVNGLFGNCTFLEIYNDYTINSQTYPVVYETRKEADKDSLAGSSTYYNGKYGLVKLRLVRNGVLQCVYELHASNQIY